jgi:hypothetical protein
MPRRIAVRSSLPGDPSSCISGASLRSFAQPLGISSPRGLRLAHRSVVKVAIVKGQLHEQITLSVLAVVVAGQNVPVMRQ